MSGTENHEPDAHKDAAQNDTIEELFRHATVRERPSRDDEQAIRSALHSQWQQMSGQRTRRRVRFALAAVASLLVAVLAVAWLPGPQELPLPASQLALIEKVSGNVFVHSAGGGPVNRAEISGEIHPGQQIVTGLESRLAMRWQDGSSVRLDQNSEIHLGTNGKITLASGQIYVDSGTTGISTDGLVILTPAGPVRHLGTQYLTGVDDGNTWLSVREGQVALELNGIDIVMAPGEQLIVDPSGARTRRLIQSHGALWEWTQSLAPAFDLDGRSLAEFLEFVQHETGRTIQFASLEAEQLAAETQLRGRIDIEPLQALDAILPTTDLESAPDGEAILVSIRK